MNSNYNTKKVPSLDLSSLKMEIPSSNVSRMPYSSREIQKSDIDDRTAYTSREFFKNEEKNLAGKIP